MMTFPLAALVFASSMLTNVAQVTQAVREFRRGSIFELTGTVSFAYDNKGPSCLFAVQDQTGTQEFHDIRENGPRTPPIAGALVRIKGFLSSSPFFPKPSANATSIDILGVQKAPMPIEVDPLRIDDGTYDSRFITLTGIVRDARIDEIDPRTHFVILDCKSALITLVVYSDVNRTDELRRLIGRQVTACGICVRPNSTKRVLTEYVVYLRNLAALQETSAAFDPYKAPDIRDLRRMTPRAISAFGRCKTSGTVLAVWQKKNVLITSADRRLTNVALADITPPEVGQTIEATGFPETDLYRINLADAIWRPTMSDLAAPAQSATNVITTVDGIFTRLPDGRAIVNPSAHGIPVHLTGVIKILPKFPSPAHAFSLAVGDTLLTVDVSAVPDSLEGLSEDCTVTVSGVCIVDTESWQPSLVMPRVRDVMLVVNQRADISLVSRPPWWTRMRLLFVLGLTLVFLCGIAIWNRVLTRLVERRGRQLFRAQIDRAGAVLRIRERSRLATELHDALSQNLAAFACELTAVRRSGRSDPETAISRLPALERMLQSCRTGLRQCLFDLRNNMLDEPDFTKVIRNALSQLGSAASNVQVRFSIPRTRLSDTTAHAVICIVRELVSNALHHGQATSVKVAGAVDTVHCQLLISVSDNGTGFDPANRPGPETGHFGIDGVDSRVRRLRGTFTLDTQPGRGTRAVVTIPLHNQECHEEN